MKAAVLVEYGRIEWREVEVPRITADEVLVQIRFAGICGSDQHVFRGEFHPRTHVPVIQGHEFGGTIVEVGSKVRRWKVGDRVAVDPIYWCGQCAACEIGHWPACRSLKLLGVDSDGGFAEFVAAKDSMLHRIGDAVTDRQAAMIEMLSIGFHACRRAGLQNADTIVVFGSGRIGQVILQAARTITQGQVFMVDVLEERLAVARRVYPDVVTIDATKVDPAEAIREMTDGRGVDIAFEAVGHARQIKGRKGPVPQCVDAIRGAGTVCVLGLSDVPAQLLMKELIWKEARLIASRVTHGEFAEAIAALEAGLLHPDAMVSEIVPAAQAQQAFELLEKHPEKYLKILLEIG